MYSFHTKFYYPQSVNNPDFPLKTIHCKKSSLLSHSYFQIQCNLYKARIYKIHKNVHSSIYSYCLKMIKMYRTEVCVVNSSYMHNRMQTTVMFKNLTAGMPFTLV